MQIGSSRQTVNLFPKGVIGSNPILPTNYKNGYRGVNGLHSRALSTKGVGSNPAFAPYREYPLKEEVYC